MSKAQIIRLEFMGLTLDKIDKKELYKAKKRLVNGFMDISGWFLGFL